MTVREIPREIASERAREREREHEYSKMWCMYVNEGVNKGMYCFCGETLQCVDVLIPRYLSQCA